MNHGIYAQATSGRTLIVGNWIFDNGDRGVQLYPAAQNVLIAHNVINGNGSGVIFAGDGDGASRDITVRDNIISNSKVRWNVESSYPAGGVVGTGNVLVHNCVWASAERQVLRLARGDLRPGRIHRCRQCRSAAAVRGCVAG